MTTASVAAGLHEDGHDIQFEADWRLRTGMGNGYRGRDGPALKSDAQLGFAVCDWTKGCMVEPCELWVYEPKGGLGSDVACDAIGVAGLDHQILVSFCGAQMDFGRKEFEFGDFRALRTAAKEEHQSDERAKCPNGEYHLAAT